MEHILRLLKKVNCILKCMTLSFCNLSIVRLVTTIKRGFLAEARALLLNIIVYIYITCMACVFDYLVTMVVTQLTDTVY